MIKYHKTPDETLIAELTDNNFIITHEQDILDLMGDLVTLNSKYSLDNRPYFEILGAKYKNEDPDSEEEVWIPIKPKE